MTLEIEKYQLEDFINIMLSNGYSIKITQSNVGNKVFINIIKV